MTIWRPPCPECGVYTPKDWARCHNCGHVFEELPNDDNDILGGDLMEDLRKFEEGLELSQQKIEQLMKQPIIETQIRTSKDRKWVIVKTVITDIKPRLYYEKVLA